MNITCLMGRLTKDPDYRTTNSGLPVVRFTLAIPSGKDKAEFINCVAWERTANLIRDHFHKGDQMGLTGRLSTNNWEDKDGNKRTSIEVTVNIIDFGAKARGSNTAASSFDDLENDDELPF